MAIVMDPVIPPKPQGKLALTVGAVLIGLGLVLGGILVFRGIREIATTVDRYQRVSATTGGTVRIDEPGTYRMFFERRGLGDVERMGYIPVTIFDPAGQPVALQYDSIDETYSFGSRSGRKMGKFDAPTAGEYQIRPLYVDGLGAEFDGMLPEAQNAQYAVGRRGPTAGIFPVLGGVFGGGAVVVLGIIFMTVGGVRRSRSKKDGNVPLAGWPAAPGPPQWNPSAPQQWIPPGPSVWNNPPPSPPPPPPSSAPPPLPAPPPQAPPPGSSTWAPRAWEAPRDHPDAPPNGPTS